MTRSKKDQIVPRSLPKPPLLYINDPLAQAAVTSRLVQLIPNAVHIPLERSSIDLIAYLPFLKDTHVRDSVFIFSHSQTEVDNEARKRECNLVRETAIRLGCNFASVNLFWDGSVKQSPWGVNHLSLAIPGAPSTVESTVFRSQDLAQGIYKWLFTVLTVKDTLHLISEKEMQEIDPTTSFKDYEYCPIGQCMKVAKDAKIQFVALIVSKPIIMSENRITWQVADKTGVANFYFKWRGSSSQRTWDWVLQLEPGQRKCLPRMPCMLVKEKLLTTVLKAPLRVPGTVIQGAGKTVKMLGTGLSKFGKSMRMGRSQKWIAEADIEAYLKKHNNMKADTGKEKLQIKVFDEKGNRMWSDKDSSHSTLWEETFRQKIHPSEKVNTA